jgi:hypothetical protein
MSIIYGEFDPLSDLRVTSLCASEIGHFLEKSPYAPKRAEKFLNKKRYGFRNTNTSNPVFEEGKIIERDIIRKLKYYKNDYTFYDTEKRFAVTPDFSDISGFFGGEIKSILKKSEDTLNRDFLAFLDQVEEIDLDKVFDPASRNVIACHLWQCSMCEFIMSRIHSRPVYSYKLVYFIKLQGRTLVYDIIITNQSKFYELMEDLSCAWKLAWDEGTIDSNHLKDICRRLKNLIRVIRSINTDFS